MLKLPVAMTCFLVTTMIDLASTTMSRVARLHGIDVNINHIMLLSFLATAMINLASTAMSRVARLHRIDVNVNRIMLVDCSHSHLRLSLCKEPRASH